MIHRSVIRRRTNEIDRIGHHPSTNLILFSSLSSFNILASCYNCNKPGHIARDCPESGAKTCYNCGKNGHISRECDAPDNRGSGGGGGTGGGGYGGRSRDVRLVL